MDGVWGDGRRMWIQGVPRFSSEGSGKTKSVGFSGFYDPCSQVEKEESALGSESGVGAQGVSKVSIKAIKSNKMAPSSSKQP